MTPQEKRAVEDAAAKVAQSVSQQIAFIQGAQFLDNLRKPSERPQLKDFLSVHPEIVTFECLYAYSNALDAYIDSLDAKPSEPETNVGESVEELVKRILNIMDNNAKEDDSEAEYLLGGQFEEVAREIAALMQPDKELLEALKHAKSLITLSSISDDAIINHAISNYEKQR